MANGSERNWRKRLNEAADNAQAALGQVANATKARLGEGIANVTAAATGQLENAANTAQAALDQAAETAARIRVATQQGMHTIAEKKSQVEEAMSASMYTYADSQATQFTRDFQLEAELDVPQPYIAILAKFLAVSYLEHSPKAIAELFSNIRNPQQPQAASENEVVVYDVRQARQDETLNMLKEAAKVAIKKAGDGLKRVATERLINDASLLAEPFQVSQEQLQGMQAFAEAVAPVWVRQHPYQYQFDPEARDQILTFVRQNKGLVSPQALLPAQ